MNHGSGESDPTISLRQRGETQQQLADFCGVSRQTINAIERNKYPPSLDVAFRIAGVFGVGIDDVFLYEPDSEGGDPIKQGVIVDVTFRSAPGGTTGGEGDET